MKPKEWNDFSATSKPDQGKYCFSLHQCPCSTDSGLLTEINGMACLAPAVLVAEPGAPQRRSRVGPWGKRIAHTARENTSHSIGQLSNITNSHLSRCSSMLGHTLKAILGGGLPKRDCEASHCSPAWPPQPLAGGMQGQAHSPAKQVGRRGGEWVYLWLHPHNVTASRKGLAWKAQQINTPTTIGKHQCADPCTGQEDKHNVALNVWFTIRI